MDDLIPQHNDEDWRASTTMYLEPTAPLSNDRPKSDYANRAPPPPYEANLRHTVGAEYENHYQVPTATPRLVDSVELKPPLPESQPDADADDEDNEDAMNKVIRNSMKGFNSNKWMHVKLIEKKGWCGMRRTKKFEVKGEGGKRLAIVKTAPSSCDCCVHLLFCGCLKKPTTLMVRDHVGNEVFLFKKLTNCCRVKPTMEITTGDGKLVGRIVKQLGIRPTLVTYDYNGDERFTVRGPWSAVLFSWGEMKFYASAKTEDGREVNVGRIRKLKSCASVRFQTQERNDRVTKLLLLASTFMVELLYYKQGKNDRPVPNE